MVESLVGVAVSALLDGQLGLIVGPIVQGGGKTSVVVIVILDPDPSLVALIVELPILNPVGIVVPVVGAVLEGKSAGARHGDTKLGTSEPQLVIVIVVVELVWLFIVVVLVVVVVIAVPTVVEVDVEKLPVGIGVSEIERIGNAHRDTGGRFTEHGQRQVRSTVDENSSSLSPSRLIERLLSGNVGRDRLAVLSDMNNRGRNAGERLKNKE